MYAGNDTFNPDAYPVNNLFNTLMLKGSAAEMVLQAGDAQGRAQGGGLTVKYAGGRPTHADYHMKKQGGLVLGTGGDNSDRAMGTFFEGAMTRGFASADVDRAIQENVVAVGYGKSVLTGSTTSWSSSSFSSSSSSSPCSAASAATTAASFESELLDILQQGVDEHVFPGAVGLVSTANGSVLFRGAAGSFGYRAHEATPTGQLPPPPVTTSTIFDMASCTKVAATTTAVALLHQWGMLDLDASVASILGPGFSAGGKGAVSVRNCLLHNAGFPPDPTPLNFWEPKFGCAGAPLPRAMSFNCSERVYRALLAQELVRSPGSAYVYSDLSFITLMYVVGTVALDHGLVDPHRDFRFRRRRAGEGTGGGAGGWRRGEDLSDDCDPTRTAAPLGAGPGKSRQCAFEAFVRRHVADAMNLTHTGFRPHPSSWPMCAPTTVPTVEHPHQPAGPAWNLQGQVEDGNSYVMGGISGHAGLFSTAGDMAKLMQQWLRRGDTGKGRGSTTRSDGRTNSSGVPQVPDIRVDDENELLLSEETVRQFTTIANHSQSSRALGWNTNDDTAIPDGGWDRSCGNLSRTTFTHVGFTGTQVCGDWERGVLTVLLTARVFEEADTGNSSGIHRIRKLFNSAVARRIPLSTMVPVTVEGSD
eukprot:g5402.t1